MTAEETSVVKMFMALEEWAAEDGCRRTWSVFRRRPATSNEAFGPPFGCELRWARGQTTWRVEKSAQTPMLAVVMALESAIATEIDR